MRKRLISLLSSALLMVPAIAVATVEQNGAVFNERIELAGEPLSLTGTGIVKYRIVFTVYAAGLYLPAQDGAKAVLDGDTPRRLEIEYFHDISAEDIIRAADTKLEAQLNAAEREALAPKIERFHAFFRGVSDGDRYRMDYVPGEGTELSFNGEAVGRVAGSDFAAAYFGIWLDPDDPLSDGLREDLLAGWSSRTTAGD